MATIAVATVNTPWGCKWSRRGYRLTGVPEPFQPETLWVCVRTDRRTPLDENKCETCEFWQADETTAN